MPIAADGHPPQPAPPVHDTALPADERIAALLSYRIMDTAQDPAFDRIAALAADLMQTPIALICFLDNCRLWVKSSIGGFVNEAPLAATVCQEAIGASADRMYGVHIVPDMHRDPLAESRRAAGADRSLRFYAGAPLITAEGRLLGTICVLDRVPRTGLPEGGEGRLLMLAAMVMDLLERKRAHDEQDRDKAEIALMRDIHLVLTENLSFSATLDRILHRLLHASEAYACRIWERRDDEAFVRLVSNACVDPVVPGHHEYVGERKVKIADLVSSGLFESDNATMWRLAEPTDRSHPRLGPAMEAGIGCMTGCSLSLGDRRFVIVLTFKGVRSYLPEMAALLGRVGLAIRPILARKLSDERATLLATALKTTHDGVIIAEIADNQLDPRIVYVNAALLAQTGYQAEELLGQSLQILRVPHSDIAEIARVRAAMRRGEAVRTMMQQRRRDGSAFWAESTLVPLLDAEGIATHRVGIMRDITQQRAEAEDLRERERVLLEATKKLETLTAQLMRTQKIAKIGTWRRDLETDVVEWSDSIYPMFGVSKDSFRPTTSSVVARVHPEDRHLLRTRVSNDGSLSIAQSVTYRTVTDAGVMRTVTSDCDFEYAPDGKAVAINGILQDVTEQKHAQAMLLQAEKLRSIGQLTGGIAHDFNNLLTVVSVNLEMLEEMLGPDHPGEELRAMALRAAEGGAQLTSNLLAFARRQSLLPANCSINTLLVGLKEMARHSLGMRHPILLSLDRDLPLCLLDRSGFESAMLNLLVNSRDAMPDGGTIMVATALHHVPPGGTRSTPASLGQIGAGTYISVSVSDNGQGIAPELLERVFEPFFTTKPFGKGTGLGLSTVIGFVRQSGGDVTLTSQPQLGTDVTLYFPVAAGPATPAGFMPPAGA